MHPRVQEVVFHRLVVCAHHACASRLAQPARLRHLLQHRDVQAGDVVPHHDAHLHPRGRLGDEQLAQRLGARLPHQLQRRPHAPARDVDELLRGLQRVVGVAPAGGDAVRRAVRQGHGRHGARLLVRVLVQPHGAALARREVGAGHLQLHGQRRRVVQRHVRDLEGQRSGRPGVVVPLRRLQRRRQLLDGAVHHQLRQMDGEAVQRRVHHAQRQYGEPQVRRLPTGQLGSLRLLVLRLVPAHRPRLVQLHQLLPVAIAQAHPAQRLVRRIARPPHAGLHTRQAVGDSAQQAAAPRLVGPAASGAAAAATELQPLRFLYLHRKAAVQHHQLCHDGGNPAHCPWGRGCRTWPAVVLDSL
mmetsp:Transcript_12441/g.31845  ORF Transcript_12441/g.31845 Transcript_12441/m.31845 type:complete len:357 (+) Transcript_12441:2102-3172(+)